MVLTLYKINLSPPARAVLMTIEALGINDVELIEVDLFAGEHLSEEFMKMNPQHTIPVLKDDDFVIWDSHAIIAYLVNKYAENHSLYPTDPKKRALIDQKLHFDSGILFPQARGAVASIVFNGAKEISPESVAKFESGYDFLEKFLTSKWLVGDEITLADISCVASVSSMNCLVPINGDLYPKVTAWLARCATQEFYKKGNAIGLESFKQLLMSKMA